MLPSAERLSAKRGPAQRSSFRVDIPRYLDLYRQGRLRLDEMISRRGELGDLNDAALPAPQAPWRRFP